MGFVDDELDIENSGDSLIFEATRSDMTDFFDAQ